MLDELLPRFRRGDRLALSRLVSMVSRGERVEEILAAIGQPNALAPSGGEGRGGVPAWSPSPGLAASARARWSAS